MFLLFKRSHYLILLIKIYIYIYIKEVTNSIFTSRYGDEINREIQIGQPNRNFRSEQLYWKQYIKSHLSSSFSITFRFTYLCINIYFFSHLGYERYEKMESLKHGNHCCHEHHYIIIHEPIQFSIQFTGDYKINSR